MTTEQDERAHCERVFDTLWDLRDGADWEIKGYDDHVDLLVIERAAVRASCAAEIERLRKQIDDLSESLDSVCGYCQDGCRCK